VVSVTDPYVRILAFLDRSLYFFVVCVYMLNKEKIKTREVHAAGKSRLNFSSIQCNGMLLVTTAAKEAT
jgi:hypothetical protein